MNFLESHRLLPCVVGLAISAALLWLASEIFAVSRTRMRPTALRLKACAVLLGGFGLWWPGHFLAPLDDGSVLGIPFLAGGLAWGLAALALITAVAATRKTVPAFAGLAVVTLLVAYARPSCSAPGARASPSSSSPRCSWCSGSSSSRARSSAPPASAALCSAPSC
jgi:hypothetical protein